MCDPLKTMPWPRIFRAMPGYMASILCILLRVYTHTVYTHKAAALFPTVKKVFVKILKQVLYKSVQTISCTQYWENG